MNSNTTPSEAKAKPSRDNPYKRKPILSAAAKKARVYQKPVTNPYSKVNQYKTYPITMYA